MCRPLGPTQEALFDLVLEGCVGVAIDEGVRAAVDEGEHDREVVEGTCPVSREAQVEPDEVELVEGPADGVADGDTHEGLEHILTGSRHPFIARRTRGRLVTRTCGTRVSTAGHTRAAAA